MNKLDSFDVDIVDIKNFNIKNKGDFWTVTTERFYYIEHFLKERNLVDMVHFENDVLLYTNLDDLLNIKELDFCVTNGGDDRMMTGFMYCKNHSLFSDFVSSFKDTKLGINNNDMFILKSYYNKGKINTIPILPNGEHSKNIELFDNSIFDCASWGQYLGGTYANPNHQKFTDPKHYIGASIIKGEVDAYFKDINGHKIPYCIDKKTNKEYKINNLHIHSKKLNLYKSK
jgi:hypothetical protein